MEVIDIGTDSVDRFHYGSGLPRVQQDILPGDTTHLIEAAHQPTGLPDDVLTPLPQGFFQAESVTI